MSNLKIKDLDSFKNHIKDQKAPIDPFKLAKEIGITINNKMTWEKLGYDGEIYLNDKNEPEIWINSTMHQNRQNFTLAHEIGHLYNDVLPNIENFQDPIKDDYTTLRRSNNWDQKEMKANKFAANLLMPVDEIKRIGKETIEMYQAEHNNQKISIDLLVNKLAQQFQVSEEAMKYRLINIGAIKG